MTSFYFIGKTELLGLSSYFLLFSFVHLVNPGRRLATKGGTSPVFLDFFSTFVIIGLHGFDQLVEGASITGFHLKPKELISNGALRGFGYFRNAFYQICNNSTNHFLFMGLALFVWSS